MKICINAGHAPNGNPDPGAVGQTGLRESDVAIIISNNVKSYLQAVGYNVLVVQNDDLQAICDASNNYGADLFISIHCNAADDQSASGTEVWYCDGSTQGAKLAQCIDTQIVNSLHTVDRGIKDAIPHQYGLYVLINTNATAVLVETAFISNADNEKLLADTNSQIEFAKAIARGVTDYV